MEVPPEAPGYENRAAVLGAIVSGELETVKPPVGTPAGVREIPHLVYGLGGGRDLELDLVLPESEEPTPKPLLVFIHGGAWAGGKREDYRVYQYHFAQRGYPTATVSYRLVREAIFPAAIEDVKGAIRWLRAQSDVYGYPKDRIVAIGGSAGGHLAMLAGYADREAGLEGEAGFPLVSSAVQAVVNFYGPCDLTTEFAIAQESVHRFLGAQYEEEPGLYAKASPLTYLDPMDPPTLIVHGALDEVVPIAQSDTLAQRLKEKGVVYQYDRLEGWPHSMDVAVPVFDRVTVVLENFLETTFPTATSEP